MSIVLNESAYQNAISNYIKANAALTRRKAWEKDEDHKEVHAFMLAQCEKSADGTFWVNIWNNTMQYGAPSEKMKAIVRERMAKAAEHKAKYAALDAKSQHIGKIKDRIDIWAKVTYMTSFETDFGYCDITVMRDAEGNVLVHKGTAGNWDKGDSIHIKATIKGHTERDGVKQTIITRPKMI
jgi:hypothetical protein